MKAAYRGTLVSRSVFRTARIVLKLNWPHQEMKISSVLQLHSQKRFRIKTSIYLESCIEMQSDYCFLSISRTSSGALEGFTTMVISLAR